MRESTTRSTSGAPLPPPAERRRLREALSLTEAEVATTIGVTRATLRSWETGRANPRGRKREAYARLLASLDAQRPEPAPPLVPRPKPSATPHGEPPPRPPAAAPAPPVTTAEEAFDELYARTAPGLVRQTYLLTGRRLLSQEAVERAFHIAWERWPEVAVDRDPAGWVRAVAYDCAMSPWMRLRAVHRYPDEPPEEPSRRGVLEALQELPPAYRRTLLLYDGLGLDLPETAAETEASTPATANRLLHAREAVAERLPELADAGVLQNRLWEITSNEPVPVMTPAHAVRDSCERRAGLWTRSVVTATALIVAATAFTLVTAPRQYDPPMSPAQRVEDVPGPQHGPPVLTPKVKQLQDKLRAKTAGRPEHLVPLLR
ncbi:sigma factor-like helix-turn-helix DNA-binding protein [Streptomyces sp. NPDC096176]|uniref:sigma factor-like helix-turn-helix DNA-binding protein n=1 Tax=Streptomyces sp. NPDC096176 TaxID=3366079 RepID=UPI00381C5B94